MKNAKGNHSQSGGIDIVAPFVEILEELIKVLIELLGIFIDWAIKKGVEQYKEKVLNEYPQKVLSRKMLSSRKKTSNDLAVGFAIARKAPLYFDELKTEKHTAIVGSTGSGKTVLLSLLQEHALSSNRAIIIFDPKTCPENIERFLSLCQKYKRKAYIVSDFYKEAQVFNPLLEGGPSEITERIMNALDWSEPFYKNESQMALFRAVRQITTIQKEEVSINGILSLLEKSTDRKTISGLISQLFNIENTDFSPLLNGNLSNSLSFSKVRDEGACVYIGISALGLGSSGNAINKLYFGALLHHCKKSYRKNPETLRPFSIFFDELSSIIHEGFIDLQNKCRGVKMEITYATQCPSDIDRLSENLTTQIFENTNNLFIFNQMIPKHTEFFAKTCGTIQTIKKTFKTENGRRGDEGSERETEEFLSHANIFRGLHVGQCVFLQRTPRRLEILNVRFQEKNSSSEEEISNSQTQSAY
jgi:type IV secretory pathway TraG/TraD family ATPase VirD4